VTPFLDGIAVVWATILGAVALLFGSEALFKWLIRLFPRAMSWIGLSVLAVLALGPLGWGLFRLVTR
jgi:hypothetical protein